MRKIIFIGRSEAGKTTLTQALKGETITYHKTQYVNNYDVIIDTPGEYAETKNLGGALAVYSYEADVVGLLISAIEPYSLYPPNVTSVCNREVIGIVTKCEHRLADLKQADIWLRLAGCEKVFFVSAYTGEGNHGWHDKFKKFLTQRHIRPSHLMIFQAKSHDIF